MEITGNPDTVHVNDNGAVSKHSFKDYNSCRTIGAVSGIPFQYSGAHTGFLSEMMLFIASSENTFKPRNGSTDGPITRRDIAGTPIEEEALKHKGSVESLLITELYAPRRLLHPCGRLFAIKTKYVLALWNSEKNVSSELLARLLAFLKLTEDNCYVLYGDNSQNNSNRYQMHCNEAIKKMAADKSFGSTKAALEAKRSGYASVAEMQWKHGV